MDSEALELVRWRVNGVRSVDEADFLEVCDVRDVLVIENVALANLNNAVDEFEKTFWAV